MRIQQADAIVLGPGKVALLEAVKEHGSISAAARSVAMSYRRAWLLMDELNRRAARNACAFPCSVAGYCPTHQTHVAFVRVRASSPHRSDSRRHCADLTPDGASVGR